MLENFRRETNIDIPLDFLDGSFSDGHVSEKSHDNHVTEEKSHDLHSKGTSSDDESSVISKHSYGCQVDEVRHPVRDFGIQSENVEPVTESENLRAERISHDFGVQSEFTFSDSDISNQRSSERLCDSGVQYELEDSGSPSVHRPQTEDFGVQSEFSDVQTSNFTKPQTEDFGVQSEFDSRHSVRNESDPGAIKDSKFDQCNAAVNDACITKEEVPLHESSHVTIESELDREICDTNEIAKIDDNISSERTHESDLAELKSFSQRFASPRPIRRHEVEEVLDEEPIQKVTVNREESQTDFASRVSTYDRLHDSHIPLPDFSDDYDDEFFQNEVDPDLLSMNLAPILEEEEEDYEEEEEGGDNSELGGNWRDNWIFNRSQFSPYTNMGKKLGGGSFDEVYLTIPQPEEDLAPRIGNRWVPGSVYGLLKCGIFSGYHLLKVKLKT